MIYPICVYGSPVLRKQAQAIDASYPDLTKLLADMYETMEATDGVGLAAPQIGKPIRIFVIDGNELADQDPNLKGFRQTFINPTILEETGEDFKYAEGCLSLPTLREEVVRKSVIKIQYQDEQFVQHVKEYTGIQARIIQHEYDHLEGIVYTDRISPFRKGMIAKKLDNIAKGKITADYKTRITK